VRTVLLLLLLTTPATATDWITAPSYYTHRDGQRVRQYARPRPTYPNHSEVKVYVYRQRHSRLQVDRSYEYQYYREQFRLDVQNREAAPIFFGKSAF